MLSVDVGERIGVNVARLPKERGWTQGQVAAKAGLSQPVISDLAGGRTKDPPISTLLKVSTAFSVELGVLLANMTSQDVDETPVRSPDLDALRIDLAALNERVAPVLDLMPQLEALLHHVGKPKRPPSSRRKAK